MAIKYVRRLHEAIIAGGVAINGVNSSGIVNPASLQAAAQSIIDAFDDSDAAQTAFEESLEPLLKDLKDQALNAIDNNDTFLAIPSPTNAQAVAQVQALTRQNSRIIRALGRVIVRTWR